MHQPKYYKVNATLEVEEPTVANLLREREAENVNENVNTVPGEAGLEDEYTGEEFDATGWAVPPDQLLEQLKEVLIDTLSEYMLSAQQVQDKDRKSGSNLYHRELSSYFNYYQWGEISIMVRVYSWLNTALGLPPRQEINDRLAQLNEEKNNQPTGKNQLSADTRIARGN